MAILLLGLFIATNPFVSVWRASGEVVGLVPEAEQLVGTDSAALALFDDDLVLATATYVNTSVSEVSQLLSDDGFQRQRQVADSVIFGRGCCGSLDGTFATVVDAGDGTVLVEFAPIDSDIGLTWGIFVMVGFFISGIGAVLMLAGNGPEEDSMVVTQTNLEVAV